MYFRLPKTPVHNLRDFAKEVGTIVLGVLIALAADQAVQNLHQRAVARDAETAVRGELQINMARMRSRWQQRDCVAKRLAEIQVLIDYATRANGVINTPAWIGRPQFWTLQTARWQASSEAGRVALLPDTELALYSTMYTYMDNVNSEMIEEQNDWARLRALEHFNRLSPDRAFQLTGTVQRARYLAWRINLWARLLQSLSDRLHLKVVRNTIPASRSACIAMDTPRDLAIRQSNSAFGDEP